MNEAVPPADALQENVIRTEVKKGHVVTRHFFGPSKLPIERPIADAGAESTSQSVDQCTDQDPEHLDTKELRQPLTLSCL